MCTINLRSIMGGLHFLLSFALTVFLVNCAVILDDDVDQQGLYSKSDRVTILTKANFDDKVYGKKYAQMVQFYNSYCGHCRSFYPKFRHMAFEVSPWKNVFRMAVIDCFNEENSEICRDFEIMSYPSLRYVHEIYIKGNRNIGETFDLEDTPEKLKIQIIRKLQAEQQIGRFLEGPSFFIASYAAYADVLQNLPQDNLYTFLVFEDNSSTIGSQLALDLSGYKRIVVKRVFANSELASLENIMKCPALVVVGTKVQPTNLTPDSKHDMLQVVNQFLRYHNYSIPVEEDDTTTTEKPEPRTSIKNALKVYYSDLEKTLRSILHTEINTNTINEESHTTFIKLLEVLGEDFPFKGNIRLKSFLEELLARIKSAPSWDPSRLNDLVKNLEHKHNPYRSKTTEYIGCRGSQPKYRGYTCGLWTLFHVLTVSTVSKPNPEGPKVLHAMHGFVKHFFGCSECVEHFSAMAARNRLFDVKDSDRAVLWLWVSHNEVNLRLAGDVTEDPEHPKIQFPSVYQCPQCRLINGAWKLPEVYQYLLTFYSSEMIQDYYVEKASAPVLGQLSNLDIGMISFLYLLSFITLIIIIKFLLRKHFSRKRLYRHGWGKV